MPKPILPDRGSGFQWRPSNNSDWPRPPQWKRAPEFHTLGRAVRELRARAGSQEQLGFEAGLHRNYVGAIERGEINPTFRILLKLATGLRVPLSELAAVRERHEERLGDGLGHSGHLQSPGQMTGSRETTRHIASQARAGRGGRPAASRRSLVACAAWRWMSPNALA